MKRAAHAGNRTHCVSSAHEQPERAEEPSERCGSMSPLERPGRARPGLTAPVRPAAGNPLLYWAGIFKPVKEKQMKSFMRGVRRFCRDEQGAQGVEDALLAGLIAIAFI